MQVEQGGDSDGDWEDEERAGLLMFPPGEEGFLQSHAGGEAVLHDILDDMTNSCVFRSISCLALLTCPVSELILAQGKIPSSNGWTHGNGRPPFWQQHTSGGSAPEIQHPRLAVRNLGPLRLCHSPVRTLSSHIPHHLFYPTCRSHDPPI